LRDVPTVDPAYPEVGTPFTVTYRVSNFGTDAPAERNDAVRILDGDLNVVAEEPATGLALPAGSDESMQVSFASGVQADGRYTVEIWVNLDGAAEGAPANEHGTQTRAAASLLVGAYATEAGPAAAGDTFRREAEMLAYQAEMVQNSSYSLQGQLESFLLFATQARTMLNAADADHPGWDEHRVAATFTVFESRLGAVQPETMGFEWPEDEVKEASVNLHQAALPFSTLPYTRQLLVDYAPPLVEAARALIAYYR
jgi:hypothetical protein